MTNVFIVSAGIELFATHEPSQLGGGSREKTFGLGMHAVSLKYPVIFVGKAQDPDGGPHVQAAQPSGAIRSA